MSNPQKIYKSLVPWTTSLVWETVPLANSPDKPSGLQRAARWFFKGERAACSQINLNAYRVNRAWLEISSIGVIQPGHQARTKGSDYFDWIVLIDQFGHLVRLQDAYGSPTSHPNHTFSFRHDHDHSTIEAYERSGA